MKVRFLIYLCLTLLVSAPAGAADSASGSELKSADLSTICRDTATRLEQELKLPRQILAGIALGESGRTHPETGEFLAWPWTIYAEGRGRYLPTKQAAVAEVKKLKAKGVRNIDVGCMQVNLHYHPKAFPDLQTALDPAANVAYAASLLKGLHKEARSWTMALGNYHSRTTNHNRRYRKKALLLWDQERRRVSEERRQKAKEAYRERRAALAAARQAKNAKAKATAKN